MKINSTTRLISEKIFEGENGSGNKVTMDMRVATEKENQSPVDLLMSALAGCVSVEIISIAKKKRKTITDLEVKSEGTRKDTDPKGLTDIHSHYIVTSPDLSEEALSKMVRLIIEGYCSVADSLKANLTYSVEVKST